MTYTIVVLVRFDVMAKMTSQESSITITDTDGLREIKHTFGNKPEDGTSLCLHI